MKPLGLTLLTLALLHVRPDGYGSKSLIEQYGFRCWLFVGLAWILWVIWTAYRESLNRK